MQEYDLMGLVEPNRNNFYKNIDNLPQLTSSYTSDLFVLATIEGICDGVDPGHTVRAYVAQRQRRAHGPLHPGRAALAAAPGVLSPCSRASALRSLVV